MRIDAGPLDLAVDIMLPAAITAHTALLICLPGGGVSRRYFDMAGFSLAKAMLAAGHALALIDPPGVGASGTIADPFQLTVEAQLPMLARAVSLIRMQPHFAQLPLIGIGHSAGAMLTACLQAHSRPYDALALLCFGPGGLPHYLAEDWLALHAANAKIARARIPEFAEAKFKTPTFGAGLRAAKGNAGHALQAVLTPTLATVALQSMTPGIVAPELATIDVPLFTAVGERDIAGPPHLLGQAYPACTDFTQIVVRRAGHHIFLCDNGPALFVRLNSWLCQLTQRQA